MLQLKCSYHTQILAAAANLFFRVLLNFLETRYLEHAYNFHRTTILSIESHNYSLITTKS